MNTDLKQRAEQYCEIASSLFQKGAVLTAELLKEKGHTIDNPMVFDIDEDAPATISADFKDDLADCYITKLWVSKNNNSVYADLYAYYEQFTLEGVCLNNELNTDWANIIEYLL